MNMKKYFNRKFHLIFILSLFTLAINFSPGYSLSKLEELSARLDSIVGTLQCNVSVQVASADKYDLLYQHNPQLKMIPASITKLVTASTAIDVLGINHEFKTVAFTDDNDYKDGIIDGNLYLKGYGDPDLNSGDIVYLAKLISEKNITLIKGNIIFDESYFDDQHYGIANYYSGDTHQNYWPYISSINLNKNGGGYDPAASAANLLYENLISINVRVEGIVISGVTPSELREIAYVSHSLFEVLARMNKESDNHSAITVFKVIGAKYDSPPGTINKGESAVVNFLTSIGNPRNIFEILEGSGLSRYNVVNSDLYVRLLKYMYDDVKTFDTFYGSLAIAGKDGTLKNRMIGTEAENNVHGKTGTLNSVSALTGYAVTRDSELLIFYIDMNGFGNSANSIRYKQD
ncbi:MAG: D-alanyl-D-alanine carboxypeptidase, partial [Ignavibacteria bacterium]